MHRRALLGAPLAAMPMLARAQADWPNRPIRTIVPYPPGGPNDIFARLYAPQLAQALKATVLVENRAGGSGVIGSDYVLKSPPDGYTLGTIDGGSLVIAPHVQASMPYRVPEDVAPITPVTLVPEALVAHPGIGARTLPELLELARRKPGSLNIGTAGGAGISHLSAYRFKSLTGAQVEVVVYRGAAPAITDLVGGQIQLLFADLPPLLPHIKANSIIPLALAARARSPALPALPTTGEYGFPKLLAENWYCAVAPRGTPQPILDRLSAAYREASETPALREALQQQGAQAHWLSMPDFARFIAEDSASWRDVVQTSGVKFD